MSLSFALSNAHSGLTATSRQAEIVANNVSNANTPGYARRSVDLNAANLDGRGVGVRVGGVDIASSPALTAERRRADADFAYQSTLSETHSQMARIVGDSDSPGSIFERYQAFETSMRSLSGDPGASHLQLDVLSKATDITRALNEAEEDLQGARLEIDREISRTVQDANSILSEIDKLNQDVRRQSAAGAETAELRALQSQLVDRLSEYVPVQVRNRDDGRIQVMTDTLFTLVGDTAVQFEFTGATLVSPAMDRIGGAPGALSELAIDGVDITPPAQTPATLTSGKLAALFTARDVEMVEFQGQIDAMATDLIDRFSNPVVDPTAGAGNPGIFTEAGAVSSGNPGAAGKLAINAAVDPAQGGALYRFRDGVGAVAEGDSGDNTQVVRMLDAFTSGATPPAGAQVSGQQTATGLVATIGSMVATDREMSDSLLAMRSGRAESLQLEEARAVGVDIDSELQQLTNIQNAYAANARVMEVVGQLLQRLLQI